MARVGSKSVGEFWYGCEGSKRYMFGGEKVAQRWCGHVEQTREEKLMRLSVYQRSSTAGQLEETTNDLGRRVDQSIKENTVEGVMALEKAYKTINL